MRCKKNIDYIYKQNLEESIIEYLSKEQIEQGAYGIENMDYKYLTQDLIENEPELFEDIV